MHCKARQVLGDLFSISQGNGSELTFVTGATKASLKNMKPQRWNNPRKQSGDINYYSDGRLEPLTNSGKSLM